MKVNASALERVFSCPGSFFAEQGFAFETNAAAEEGNLLHAVMAGSKPYEPLTREQKRLIDICRAEGREIRERVFPDGKPQWQAELFLRWSSDSPAGQISAKLDFVAALECKGLILDWKFGRTPTPMAECNYQLRAYALAARREYPNLSEITVAIIQPYNERGERTSVATYTIEDLGLAEAEFRGLFRTLAGMEKNPNLRKRIPSDAACKYCRALGTERCPESQEIAKALVQIQPNAVMPVGADLSDWLDRAAVAEDLIKALRDHARAEIAAGREVPGYTLSTPREVRQINDVAEAWMRMESSLSSEAFMGACKVTVGGLEDAYAAATGKRGKELRQAFDEALGPALSKRTDHPSLVKA